MRTTTHDLDHGSSPSPSSTLTGGALTSEQHARYERDGYLLLAGAFSPDEVNRLRAGLAEVMAERTERTVLEVGGDTVRSVYGIHQHNRVFGELARHPRLLHPVQQVLRGPVYVYQSRVNAKAVFGSDVWPWHQDYVFWRNEDAMPTARAVTVAVFLDDVTEANGPVCFIPGSHRHGVLAHDTYDGQPPGYEMAPTWVPNLVARLKYTLARETFVELALEHGVVAPKGPAGSVLVFDSNLAHASAQNLSPRERTLAMFIYNRVDNAPDARGLHRPEFLVSRDVRALEPVADDALRAGTA